MVGPIRVLLADDSEIMRRAIVTLLSHDPTVAIIAEAHNYAEMVALLTDCQFDVVLMDLRMPGEEKFDALAFKDHLRGSCLLAISLWNDQGVVKLAESFGAFKLLDKGSLATTLLRPGKSEKLSATVAGLQETTNTPPTPP